MSARDDILASVRRSLKRGRLGDTSELDRRLAEHPRGLVPARAASRDHAGQVLLFAEMAQEVMATIERVAALADVPRAVADYLVQQNLPAELVMAPDKSLDEVPWGARPLLKIRHGKPQGSDLTGVSGCLAAVAETGTLMIASGPDSPSTLNFLPDTHIAVVKASQVVASYEDGWDRLRGTGAMPRTVNFITGPSRTADIELKIQLGAHGPRRLHLVVVDGA